MYTHRLKPRPDPMLSRMVRAAHPSFTRMVRSSPSDSFARMVRAPTHLRMVPPLTAAFREDPLETGSLNQRVAVGIVCSARSICFLLLRLSWLRVFHVLDYKLIIQSPFNHQFNRLKLQKMPGQRWRLSSVSSNNVGFFLHLFNANQS